MSVSFSYDMPGKNGRWEIWKLGQKESNHTPLKTVYPQTQDEYCKEFHLSRIVKPSGKRADWYNFYFIDQILISTSFFPHKCKCFPVKSLQLAVIVWVVPHWRALIFFLLKLSGGNLKLWIKRLTHSYLWFNNCISRNLYQWNNWECVQKIAMKYSYHHNFNRKKTKNNLIFNNRGLFLKAWIHTTEQL